MLRPYLKIWDWDWIFGRAVKAILSLGVRSPWLPLFTIEKWNINLLLGSKGHIWMTCSMFFFPLPCQIFFSWVDYVLKISNKPIIFINRGFIYQFLMIVMMEILLWIKCIIFFPPFLPVCFRLLLTDQLFNFCLKKKNLLHFTFPSRFYGCLSMSPPKVIQIATNVFK